MNDLQIVNLEKSDITTWVFAKIKSELESARIDDNTGTYLRVRHSVCRMR